MSLIVSDERGPDARKLSDREAANRETVLKSYVDMDRTKDFEEVRHLFAPEFVDHNVDVPNGNLEGLGEFLAAAGGGPFETEVVRVLVDGDFVSVLLRGRMAPDAPVDVVMEIYRLRDGRIAEHWETVRPLPSDSPNPVAGF